MVVIHRQGAWRRVLLVRAAPGGAGLTIEQSHSLAAADDGALSGLVMRFRPDCLVRVIPAARLIVRPLTGENGAPAALPSAADPSRYQGAMDLLAEATLGSSTEPHRRSAGVLKVSDAQLAVAVAWVGDEGKGDALPRDLSALDRAGTFVPEIAALAALMDATPGAALAIAADRAGGSLCALATAGGKAAARTMNEDGDDGPVWAGAVAGAVAQVSRAVGTQPPSIGTGAEAASCARLLSPAGAVVRAAPGVRGVSAEQGWLDQFGVALGAALAFSSAGPGARPLLSMVGSRPVPHVPAMARVAQWMSSPRKAAAIFLLCVGAMLLWPLGVAWARLEMLSRQAQRVGTDDSVVTEARQQSDFYRLLFKKRWPMTKLLGDLTASLPVGITFEELTLEYNQKVQITGTAESAQVLTEWREALDKSRVFDEVLVKNAQATNTQSGTFKITARVAQPLLVLGSTEKAGESVLVVKPTTQAPATEPSRLPAPERRAESPADTRSANAAKGRTGTRAAKGDRGDAEKASADAIPPPLSDEEIARFDFSAAIREFGLRGKASKTVSEPVAAERLKAEVEKLRARLDALRGSGQ